MSVSGVVVLADGSPLGQLEAELVGMGLRVYLPDEPELPPDLPKALADARRVAAVAIWLRTQGLIGPLVVLAVGDRSRLLPAVALSQRSSGRLINGYVLLDAPSPAPAMDWPDAPVWWVATGIAEVGGAGGALSARLRGFEVVELPGQGSAAFPAVARVVARAAGVVLER